MMPISTTGVLAEFYEPAEALAAAVKVRDAGYKSWDCHTPYAVHGLDEAMGLPKTKIGWFSFAFGMTGISLAWLMIWWISPR